MRHVFWMLFLLLTSNSLFSQGIPVFNLKDTSITTSGCYLYDPTGHKGGYTPGTVTMVINSGTSATLGVAFDSLKFVDDRDYINIYDGNSTNAPLITTVKNGFSSWMMKSSGTSLTISMHAVNVGTTDPIFGWGAHIYSINTNPRTSQFSTAFTGFLPGNFDLADYDKDGDTDILNGGIIFRNDSRPDSAYMFLKKATNPLGQWVSASMTGADFNGDGYKDIFVIGQYVAAGNYPSARLFVNDGKGGFTESSQAFTGASQGRCVVVDYNKDGKPDISYIGASQPFGGAPVCKLYINKGGGTFAEQATNIPGFLKSSLDWADVDNDGDLDIVINGEDATKSHAMLLLNNNGSFTEKKVGLFNSTNGEIHFADIDMDGKPDIINTGVTTPGNIDQIPTQILMNNGDGNFTSLVNNLPRMRSSYMEWKDFDNDGDMDMVMSGTNSLVPAAYVYKNNGNGDFKTINLGGDESYSSVHWVDINGDSRPDVFVATRSGSSYVAKNINNDSFAIVTQPMPSLNGMGAALVDDFNDDGNWDIMFAGSIQDYDCIGGAGTVFMNGLGWKYLTLPVLTKVANMNSLSAQNFKNPYWKWGDFDSDGLLDVFVTNLDNSVTGLGDHMKIFKNMGNNVFQLAYNGVPLPQSYLGKAAFVDLDNDGKNEMVAGPVRVCKWNGSSFDLVYQSSFVCCDSYYMDFGDYNNDGYLDMLLSANGHVKIFKNDKKGKLVELSPGYIGFENSASSGFVKFADMDKDGLLDIVTSNYIFKNSGNDIFLARYDNFYQWASAAIGDFNNDGYPDIFGLTILTSIGPTNLYYSQGPNFFYKGNTPVGFPRIDNLARFQDAAAFDIDRDGDVDIVHSAEVCSSGLLLNYNNLVMDALVLTAPNGGEKLYVSNSYNIKWGGNNIGSAIAIMFSSDNGKTFQSIQTAAPSANNGGSYVWAVPSITSDSCLIKIIAANQTTAVSRSVFSISNSLPAPDLSSVAATICKNAVAQSVTIKNWPDAGAGINVSATLDTKPIAMSPDHSIKFSADTLAEGQHSLVVKFYSSTLTKSTEVKFEIAKNVTPAVSLHASVTNIVNMVNPVLLTATNEGGGGSQPLFMFASDSNFTQIVQQLSTSNKVEINPSSLQFGANTFYVLMKTSDSCALRQNATARVVITRTSATGIIDPDNPENIIGVYPNPFGDQLTVSSLNPQKVYVVSLINSNGQTAFSQEVSNTAELKIPTALLPAGIYELKIYDKTKNRLLGTMKVMRR
ncbi:T9SS type A sorting domain-containing protein [Chitinophagaceae bacterium 26-R-25]|nr:T9SS type A sorting domain-containing protein [Chitinophagaceae bacterium 26-R-25]